MAWMMWQVRLYVNPYRPCKAMVCHLTVASDCRAGCALASPPRRSVSYTRACRKLGVGAGMLHAGSLWAFLHARAPARIGQQTPD